PRSVLLWHLEGANDTSTAVWSIYGQRFASLFSLNSAMFTDLVPVIFGSDERTQLQQVAWESYIASTDTYLSVFTALEDVYFSSVRRLGRLEDRSRSRF